MTRVWRIVKEKCVGEAFSGEGARQAGGRFNSPGRPVVYTSESLALAQLEILVNLPTDRLLASYVAFQADIPDRHVETLSHEELPENWREAPAPRRVRTIGDRWLQSGRSPALRVPSAVVPSEHNVLIDPLHPDFEEASTQGPFDLEEDRLQ